ARATSGESCLQPAQRTGAAGQDRIGERTEGRGDLASFDPCDPGADGHRAGERVHGDLHLLSLAQIEGLDDLHGQRNGERTAGLDERTLHTLVTHPRAISTVSVFLALCSWWPP